MYACARLSLHDGEKRTKIHADEVRKRIIDHGEEEVCTGESLRLV